MASYSSSSSSSSSASQSPHPWRYDVFLSFRGQDTRRSFCSRLYDALCRKALRTFIDEDELHIREEIAESIVQAIQESNVAVVVFSKYYVSSAWCLDDLVKIIECRQIRGQIVIPVFYDVNQSDIRSQSHYVAEAFERHEQNPRNAHKIQYWRDALVRTGNIYGFNSENFRDDGILISEIVEDISKILVIACLRGKREETVVLRCLNKQITKNNRVIIRGNVVEKLQNNAITEDLSEDESETEPSRFLLDVLECLKEDEQNKFRDNIKTMVTELSWPTECNDMLGYRDEEYIEEESFGSYNDQSSEECSGNEEVSPYSEKAFKLLEQKLDSITGSRKRIKLGLSDDEKQLVKYGKYIAPRIFIPILKQLINGKHGDISSGSMLDARIKSICFMYLSEVIYSMTITKVQNIKKDMLHTWWNRRKVLELVGFKVDFIQDHLMLVASKASNFADKTSKKQVSKIEQLEEEIKVLMGRVEELKLQHRNHLEYVKSSTTPLMAMCFSDAKAMKWRPAAEGLL